MVTASSPFNVRRYGDRWHGQSVYYTRSIYRDGVQVGVWEDYATLWRKDWKHIRVGEYLVVDGRVQVEEKASD